MPKNRLASSAGVLLALYLASCGGSAAAPTATSADQSGWQVILTVKSTYSCFGIGSNCGFGIAGVALDGQGNLYLTEFDDDLIYEYTASGALVRRWGGIGSGPGQLTGPEKLSFDRQGDIYVTEVGTPTWDGSVGGNNRVQKFSPNGAPLARWGTLGTGPGQFNVPVGIGIDAQGNIYVADVANHRVQKLSSSGIPLMQWHTVGTGTGERTETGYDLAVDATGNVFVSEPLPFGPGAERIEKFSAFGERLTHWGTSGTGPGQFDKPFGLSLDSKGNVYVVDSGNNRIQEFSPTGQFMAQWKGPEKGFIATSKVALDDQGNIFASRGNQVVKLHTT